MNVDQAAKRMCEEGISVEQGGRLVRVFMPIMLALKRSAVGHAGNADTEAKRLIEYLRFDAPDAAIVVHFKRSPTSR